MSTAIRFATPTDADAIFQLIHALAVYEEAPNAVEATPDSIRAQLEMEHPPFECVVIEDDGAIGGFALFFHNYSTWTGVQGLYLEDLFVPEKNRGRGYGKALMAKLAQIAVERGCARMEWQVLDWNESAIEFYESLGAEVRRDWFPCRLDGSALSAMAGTDGKG